ncbi:MAG: hypothetical protein AB7L66_11500 [Gemmatimonadales bacterium]
MKETIDLAPILRDTVATPYSDLVTRPTGVSVRRRVEEVIAASPHPTAQLDFGAIGLLDFSCADEIVAKLLLNHQDERPRYVVLINVTEAQREAIDHVLENHNLTVVARPTDGDRPVVLGWRTPDLVAAFYGVIEIGPGDARRLADTLGWTVERAADALQSLALRRLIQAASGTYIPLPLL